MENYTNEQLIAMAKKDLERKAKQKAYDLIWNNTRKNYIALLEGYAIKSGKVLADILAEAKAMATK